MLTLYCRLNKYSNVRQKGAKPLSANCYDSCIGGLEIVSKHLPLLLNDIYPHILSTDLPLGLKTYRIRLVRFYRFLVSSSYIASISFSLSLPLFKQCYDCFLHIQACIAFREIFADIFGFEFNLFFLIGFFFAQYGKYCIYGYSVLLAEFSQSLCL